MKYNIISGISIGFVLLLSLSVIAQRPAPGKYTGLEKITVTSGNAQYWPGIYKFYGADTSTWYHETTITITDSSIGIEKRPLAIKDNVVTYSDSTGGFYSYTAKIRQDNESTFKIWGIMLQCKYCPRTATAIPRYVNVSYTIHAYRRKWMVDTDFEKNLIFNKQ